MAINDKKILKSIKPNKRLGQNFLINKTVLSKIIKAADLSKKDFVLEIGPGTGTLTEKLALKVKNVVAVEKDKKMCGVLNKSLKNYKNIEIINDDILEFLKNSKIKNFKVVANIPYYITSRLIRILLERESRPDLIVLTIQKEVGQRICAKPPNMSLLSISVQFYAKSEIICYISKNSFWPKPQVDSVMVKIRPLKTIKIDSKLFFKVLKAGFKQPRKKIVNNISKGLDIEKEEVKKLLFKVGVSPDQRPQTLSVQNWVELAKAFMV